MHVSTFHAGANRVLWMLKPKGWVLHTGSCFIPCGVMRALLMWALPLLARRCRVRDSTLPRLGVRLEDRPDGSSICKFMSAAEQAEARPVVTAPAPA